MLARRGWLLCLGVVACVDEPGPCYGLSLDARYRIDLLDAYDEQSSFLFDLGRPVPPRCGDGFDLQPADTLNVRIVEQMAMQFCMVNVADFDPAPPESVPWDFGETRIPLTLGASDSAEALVFSRSVSIMGCQGTWGFSVQGRIEPIGQNGNPFLVAEPGTRPPIILGRGFVADADTPECRSCLPENVGSCTDYFVVVMHQVDE